MSGITLAHTFVSAKGNGTDLTLIQPSNWNDQHVIKLDANNLLGKLTAGNGPVEQVPLTAFMATLLAAPDAATLAGLLGLFTTGDVKPTLKTVADTGWVMGGSSSTIGNVGSGATYANVNALALYTLIWTNISQPTANTYSPVTGGLGASAAADWAGLKPLNTGWWAGHALGVAGAGGSLTTRALGAEVGEETHLLSTGEMPSHYHAASIYDPSHTHSGNFAGGGGLGNNNGGGGGSYGAFSTYLSVGGATTGVRINSSNGLDTTYSAGGGGYHNNMQPTKFVNVMIKL